MNSRGGEEPPPPAADAGKFLLNLLHRTSNSSLPQPQQPQPSSLYQNFSDDPAVAAVGPSLHHISSLPPTNSGDFPFPSSTQNHFRQNFHPNPNLNPNSFFNYNPAQFDLQSSSGDDTRKLSFYGNNSKSTVAHGLTFGSLDRGANLMHQSENNFENGRVNSTFSIHKRANSSTDYERMSGSHRTVGLPPGFSRHIEHGIERKPSDGNGDKGKGGSGRIYKNDSLNNQHNFPAGTYPHPASNINESIKELASNINESIKELHLDNNDAHDTDGLEDQALDSLGIEDESSEKSDKKKYKDYRSDERGGQLILDQRKRMTMSRTTCRNDINKFNAPLLALYQLLIPSDEEKIKQKQLLMQLENLVRKEWPDARLFLYGSCANSFGFSKSDIDVCLRMDLAGIDKSEVLLKLANIFETHNLQNVQALTRARVPIVKLMDPVTGISCDICINNMLAVVNTKLLFDYAQIDVRLRQLAFIVKHWAKSRGVNATYQGTLSSYAYVLMCIHLLQQRRPHILPCLQKMQPTYFQRVDGVECAYFDQVEKLHRSQNGESIAQLVWAFFHYWAYRHDYTREVISVRTGSTVSKWSKDWTRRVGNDRHLICIEDPFETSHDLGRVVDKHSIRVLRVEFERAAHIMQCDPNPCVALFEPYIPPS